MLFTVSRKILRCAFEKNFFHFFGSSAYYKQQDISSSLGFGWSTVHGAFILAMDLARGHVAVTTVLPFGQPVWKVNNYEACLSSQWYWLFPNILNFAQSGALNFPCSSLSHSRSPAFIYSTKCIYSCVYFYTVV